MKLDNHVFLKERYDVIVVGAGLGGLTAASLLAKRGLAVLMIDRQDKPGGSCTSFRREGVTYDVGTAMLYGFGERGFKPFRFLMNELEEPVEIVAHTTLARMTFEGSPITFWPDVERFLQELDRLFPEEKEGLRAFYSDLYRMYENIVLKNEVIAPPDTFSARQGLRSLMNGPLEMLRMQKLLSTSVRSLLDRYFHTPGIINFFDKLCSAYCYCTADETPAVLAATMFLDNHIGGVYYPAGGAQMLPNKIEKAFERLGGQALYRTLVDEILIRGRQAYGVRLADGTEILADRIVANATVWNLYGKLVRPEHIRPERLAWVQNLVPTFPSMTLYLLVDRSALPENVLPWEVFIENRAVIDNSDLTLYINSLVDDTLCPPGKLVITVIAPNLANWPSPSSPEYHSTSYRQQKQAEAQHMLDQIEQHFPGFCSKIEVLDIGTPTTIERFLLKNGGAVGGPKNMIGQEMLRRLHARSEWKNLYLCGDSTVMATGAPATVVSGVGAANLVLRDLHRPEYDSHRFERQFIQFVQTPYRRNQVREGEDIQIQNAPLWAAQCQGCQEPACVRDCPAGIDIPGVMRRMEAGNFLGAAREVRQRTPFGSLCSTACNCCERYCYRQSFAGQPVRIAKLVHLVSQTAPGDGNLSAPAARQDGRVLVLGANLAGLSCAYYLMRAGVCVEVLDRQMPAAEQLGCSQPDLQAVLDTGLRMIIGEQPALSSGEKYLAVYEAALSWQSAAQALSSRARVRVSQSEEDLSPVVAAAKGRQAAINLLVALQQEMQ